MTTPVDFNPYAPPNRAGAACAPVHASLGRIHCAFHWSYVAVVVFTTAVLAGTRPPAPDLRTLEAALYFYAPALCFIAMRFSPARRWPTVLGVYGLYVSILLGIFVWDIVSPAPDPGIGVLIVALNAGALLAGGWQLRRAQAQA